MIGPRIVAVFSSALASHTCALFDNGKAACWGLNNFGQLGNGTTNNSHEPVWVNGLHRIESIALAGSHTCALTQNKQIFCWGGDKYAQLGLGLDPGASSLKPEWVLGFGDVKHIAAGSYGTCALLRDGRVRCWGTTKQMVRRKNIFYEIKIKNVRDLVAGDAHFCALLKSGKVRCWGSNERGQLGGDVPLHQHFTLEPIKVRTIREGKKASLNSVEEISAGANFTCALLKDKKTYCWGDGSEGQFAQMQEAGPGGRSQTNIQQYAIYAQTKIEGITQANSWIISGADINYFGNPAGDSIVAIGDERFTLLEGGKLEPKAEILKAPLKLGNVAQFAAGARHACALLKNQSLFCFGENNFGQLGNGASIRSAPVEPKAGLGQQAGGLPAAALPLITEEVKNISSSPSAFHTCAVLYDGRAACWGQNDKGQLGDGSKVNRNAPVLVHGLADVDQIVTGLQHTCARLKDGTVACWGDDEVGQLGDELESGDASQIPKRVEGLSGVSQLSAGAYHTCALRRDGTVWCWGTTQQYVLGVDPEAKKTKILIKIKIEKVEAIAAGSVHTCALLKDRTVRCWGFNGQGQLGGDVKTQGASANPVEVKVVQDRNKRALRNVTSISAGARFSCAVRSEGKPVCWGDGSWGQLLDGQIAAGAAPDGEMGIDHQQPYANEITKYFKNTSIISGGETNYFLLQGLPYAVGGGRYGQLGNGRAGTFDLSLDLALVKLRAEATQVAAGAVHACVLLADRSVWCFGNNERGQLGSGKDSASVPLSAVPVQVKGLGTMPVGPASGH
jgi:alpha-tubulin suppressor-like RCC1 family protein